MENKLNVIGWQPIENYFLTKDKYDWVLVKFYDGDIECIPCVMEYRIYDEDSENKTGWYSRTNNRLKDCFTPKYFFSMKQLDGEIE